MILLPQPTPAFAHAPVPAPAVAGAVPHGGPLPAAPQRYRQGFLELVLGRDGPLRLDQRQPLRALFPWTRAQAPRLAVLANVGGGVAAGDSLSTVLTAAPRARWQVVAQSAERIYRAPEGDDTAASLTLEARVTDGAWLELLPQPVIAFDGARLRRRTRLSMTADATLLWGDILVLGRLGRGERLSRGVIDDQVMVRDARGHLLWLDALQLEPAAAPELASAGWGLGGAGALATILAHGGAVAERLEPVRETLGESVPTPQGCRMALTAHRGLLIARLLAPDAHSLRPAFAALWLTLRQALGAADGGPLPTFWG